MTPPLMSAMRRLALPVVCLACLAGPGVAAPAEPAQADKHAKKHPAAHAHTQAQAHTPAHKPAHAAPRKPSNKTAHSTAHTNAHAAAHKPAQKTAHKPNHKPNHKLAHDSAHNSAHNSAHKPAHDASAKAAHAAARAAALAASQAPAPAAARTLPKPAPSNLDPDGEGFLNLYVELCVKRIGEIDTFREKLLREKVPRLQPEAAKPFLSGMEGDAWPVPYQGKMGNFVLVLPAQKNLCMLYARRTDTAAVEQGFAAMVAKAPDPMIATRGPEMHTGAGSAGASHTMSTSWAPPGSERRMQFMLTTTASNDTQVQAFGSVAIVVGPEPGPGPERASASRPPTRTPNGSPAPADRPRARP